MLIHPMKVGKLFFMFYLKLLYLWGTELQMHVHDFREFLIQTGVPHSMAITIACPLRLQHFFPKDMDRGLHFFLWWSPNLLVEGKGEVLLFT